MSERALRLAFAGTPQFAATILAGLLARKRHPISCVFTQPDRPAGRGRRNSASPVRQLASQHQLPVYQPLKSTVLDPADALAGIDVFVVVAFGMLLPAEILARPRLGCLNVHPSLLPRWRGAAPVQRAIEAGDAMTGVSIMQMDAGLDTGDVLTQRDCRILADDTSLSLGERLAAIGEECLSDTLDALAAGTARRTTQDSTRATYARKIQKDDLRIDWLRPATEIERSIRAFNPEPLARTTLDGTDMLIWRATTVTGVETTGQPGSVIGADAQGIDVSTGRDVLRIQTLQLPGKKPISAADFVNARPHWKRGG